MPERRGWACTLCKTERALPQDQRHSREVDNSTHRRTLPATNHSRPICPLTMRSLARTWWELLCEDVTPLLLWSLNQQTADTREQEDEHNSSFCGVHTYCISSLLNWVPGSKWHRNNRGGEGRQGGGEVEFTLIY